MEAFSSQGDGTLTIIQETGPTSFEVEQTVTTKSRAKTCALDTRNNRIVLITTEPTLAAPTPATTAATSPPTASAAPQTGTNQPMGGRRDGRGGGNGPSMLDILVVGR